jgi:hypothetical protein
LAQAENVNEDIAEITKILQKNNITFFVAELCKICELKIPNIELTLIQKLNLEKVIDTGVVFATILGIISRTISLYLMHRLIADVRVGIDGAIIDVIDPATGEPAAMVPSHMIGYSRFIRRSEHLSALLLGFPSNIGLEGVEGGHAAIPLINRCEGLGEAANELERLHHAYPNMTNAIRYG